LSSPFIGRQARSRLDQGFAAAETFIAQNLFDKIEAIIEKRSYQDAKSRFQELAQEKRGITPIYETLSEVGPDHNKVFTVGLFVGKEEVARGEGQSKQESEQAAAHNALEKTGW
jgi:ribonuclease-3